MYRISQSLTGNLLTVSVGGEEETTYLYEEGEAWNQWKLVEELK